MLVGMISGDDESRYRSEISNLQSWCLEHNLLLNADKTKELIFNFSRKSSTVQPVCIDNKIVERVNEFKYLGVIINDELGWKSNTKLVYNKCMQRMYFLRKLK